MPSNNPKSLEDKTQELEVLFKELKEIQKIIINCTNIIASVSNDYVRQTYMDDVKPYVEDHKKLSVLAQNVLEQQFQYERAVKVYSLPYRKFYKQIIRNLKV